MTSNWSLIENGNFAEAYKNYTEEYEKSKSIHSLSNRVIVSLIMKNYTDVLNDYLTCLELRDETNLGDGDYINIGVAYWLLGEYEQAKKMWVDSMLMKFRYTLNIVSPPAIVYFAGAYLKDDRLIKSSVKYLKRRGMSEIPLAGFLLDEISEEELLNTVKVDSPMRDRTLCKYEFYIGLKYLQKGNRSKFINHLKKCIELKGNYLEYEYFLAVGELDKIKD